MRTLDGGQATNLAAATRSVHSRVFIENGSGTLKNLSNLGSVNWIDGIVFQSDIDQFSDRLTLTLKRDNGTLSLAPLREDSILNRLDDGTTYAPLIDPNRLVVWEQATLPVGASPSAGDWEEVFRGHIGEVDSGSDTIRLECYDFGRRLVRRFLMLDDDRPGHEIVIGSTLFTIPIEVAIQGVLDMAFDPVTDPVNLYTPTSPLTEVGAWKQGMESISDILVRIAGSIGWVVRFKWHEGTSSWRPTFFDPGRDKTTPDYTLNPNRYFGLQRLTVDDEAVRNQIRVFFSTNSGLGLGTVSSSAGAATFSNSQTGRINVGDVITVGSNSYTLTNLSPNGLSGTLSGAPTFSASTFTVSTDRANRLWWEVDDATSIARFGLQPMGIGEPDGSIINTPELAAAMAGAILSDLKDPKAEAAIEMPYFWPVELGDLYRVAANGVHSNVDQDWAVTGIQHELTTKVQRTRLTVRGKPAGAFYGWRRQRGPVGQPVPPDQLPSIPIVTPIWDQDGTLTLHLRGLSNTRSFRIATSTTGPPASGDITGADSVNAVNGEAEYEVAGIHAVGDFVYWRVRAYTAQDGVGLESVDDAIDFSERPKTTPRVNAGSFSPWIATGWEGTTAYLDGPVLKGGTLSSGSGASADVTPLLPPGATVRGIRARVYTGDSTSDPFVVYYVRLRLRRVSNTGVATTVFDMDDSGDNQDWITISTTTLESGETGVVATGESWYLDATVEVAGWLLWAEVEYTVPSVLLFPGGPVNYTDQSITNITGMDGSGTTGKLAKFVAGEEVGDSIISESGTTATVGGTLDATVVQQGGTQVANTDDSRFPTAGEKSALAGTSGAPSGTNKYVTNADARNTNERVPTDGSVTNAKVAAGAGILWSKISKAGSALSDLASRAFSELTGSIGSAQHGDLSAADSTSPRHHWNQITSKPTEFPPQAHGHGWADVSKVGSSLADLATRAYSALTFSGLTTGHVWRATAAGAASFGTLVAASFADATIALSRLVNSAASGLSVIGRSANSAGPFAEINAGTDGHVLRRLGTALGFGTLASGAYADNTIAPSRITNIAQNQVLGRTTAGTGAVSAIATSALTGMSAAGLTTGTLPDARFPAVLPAVSGANLTDLPQGFNVKAFGATGDGVTDDSTAINNAIAAMDGALGGILLFPPGTYKINTQVYINKHNIAVHAEGAFFTSTAAIFVFRTAATRRVTMRGGTFDFRGNSTSLGGFLVELAAQDAGFDNVRILADVSVLTTFKGISIDDSYFTRINGCQFNSSGGTGLFRGSAVYLGNQANATWITQCSFGSCIIGLNVANANAVRSERNAYEQCTNGVVLGNNSNNSHFVSTHDRFELNDFGMRIDLTTNPQFRPIIERPFLVGNFTSGIHNPNNIELRGALQNGSVVISGTDSSTTVTFVYNEDDANYQVFLEAGTESGSPAIGAYNTRWGGRTTTGFGIGLETAPGAGSSVRVFWRTERA